MTIRGVSRDATINDELRERSGNVVDERKLVGFLYDLMKGHVPPGRVEQLVRDSQDGGPFRLSNGYLARYAQDLAERLHDE